jgi:hypothetical protein
VTAPHETRFQEAARAGTFEDCNEAEATTDPDAENGVRPHALNSGDAVPLWDVSVSLLHG